MRGFVASSAPGERERVLVRTSEGELELRVELPLGPGGSSLDRLAQLVEGVSHFLLLAERARADRTTCLLELELQAEVDKVAYLLLGPYNGAWLDRTSHQRRHRSLTPLRTALFERTVFLHGAETEAGLRYRTAQALAARFTQRLEAHPAPTAALRRFYRAPLEEKVWLAA